MVEEWRSGVTFEGRGYGGPWEGLNAREVGMHLEGLKGGLGLKPPRCWLRIDEIGNVTAGRTGNESGMCNLSRS